MDIFFLRETKKIKGEFINIHLLIVDILDKVLSRWVIKKLYLVVIRKMVVVRMIYEKKLLKKNSFFIQILPLKVGFLNKNFIS